MDMTLGDTMDVILTPYDRKLAGRVKDARRRAVRGSKTRVYKPVRDVPARDRWEG